MFDRDKKLLNGLYVANFFWSFSTLMITSSLGIYYEHVLKISKMDIGSITGWALFACYMMKLFCGVSVDLFKNYRFILLLGSFFSMCLKPMYGFVTSIPGIITLKCLERMTKGMRSAPCDPLVATVAHKKKGFALSSRLFAYTFGSCIGAVFASIFLATSNLNFTFLYKLSFIPNIIAISILFIWLKPGKEVTEHNVHKNKIQWKEIFKFPPKFWILIIAVFFITLCRVNEAFLANSFYQKYKNPVIAPLSYFFWDGAFSFMAIMARSYFDRVYWLKPLILSLLCLVLANVLFFTSTNIFLFVIGTMAHGFHVALCQGTVLTRISTFCDQSNRGVGFALYNMAYGVALLISGKLTGYIAHIYGSWQIAYGYCMVASLSVLAVLIACYFFNKKSSIYASDVLERKAA